MGKYFHHLSYDNRLLLKQMLDNEYSVKKIADELGVHISTIYREIKRFENPSQYTPRLHNMYGIIDGNGVVIITNGNSSNAK